MEQDALTPSGDLSSIREMLRSSGTPKKRLTII